MRRAWSTPLPPAPAVSPTRDTAAFRPSRTKHSANGMTPARGVRTGTMRSAAASAISQDATAAVLATTKFQSDFVACCSTSQTAMAATASQPIAAARDRVAHRGTRPLSACSSPGPAPVARGPNAAASATPNAAATIAPRPPASASGRSTTRERKSSSAIATTPRASHASTTARGEISRESPRTTQIAAKMPEKTTRCIRRLRRAPMPALAQAERRHRRQRRQGMRQRDGERRDHAGGEVAGHRVGAGGVRVRLGAPAGADPSMRSTRAARATAARAPARPPTVRAATAAARRTAPRRPAPTRR